MTISCRPGRRAGITRWRSVVGDSPEGGTPSAPEQARDHIVGYTVFNDWSAARTLQRRKMKGGGMRPG
ncbi:fumarylacetoacetate hydrolase family protein [Streptomyces sp. DHE17-7]|uniref:fumarylacetoacetate hydrolase family protein n=1 Tax=Streptomyces sp. DHE17-7 TaxID=2759949 RepID=UPI003FA7B27F